MPIKFPGYNKGRECCICRSGDTYIYHGTPQWRTCTCGKECCTGYLCMRCYNNYIINPRHYNMMKHTSKLRNETTIDLSKFKDLDRKNIGNIIEYIVCETFGIKNINDEYDNYNSKFDAIHPIYKNLQIKGGSLNIKYGMWTSGLSKGRKFGDLFFDTLIYLCMDENKPWKEVLRVYVIPYGYLFDITSITIYKDFNSRWDRFRIDKRPFNDIWHDILKVGIIQRKRKKEV